MSDLELTYLDYAASAPRRDEVTDAMAPWMHGVVGNPTGQHREARRVRQALDEARDVIASFVGEPVHEVVFTGGGTESCYLAIAGRALAHAKDHPVSDIVISPTEHSAVLKSARTLAEQHDNIRVRILDVDSNGIIETQSLFDNLSERTAVVSVMTTNNETGVYQPIPLVGSVAAGAVPGGAVTHTDAVAAATHLYLPAMTETIDLISLSAHKLGGPVNSGALIFRRDVPFESPLPGGGQERGRRGGTPDVAAAVGLATACALTAQERSEENDRLEELRLRFENALSYLPGLVVTARGEARNYGTTHVTIEGLANEETLFLLDQAGVCASGGSSCASGALEASHVLLAMGMSPERASTALRFTYGRGTTQAELDHAVGVLADIVYRLRA